VRQNIMAGGYVEQKDVHLMVKEEESRDQV
jgi:hypothetical protein